MNCPGIEGSCLCARLRWQFDGVTNGATACTGMRLDVRVRSDDPAACS